MVCGVEERGKSTYPEGVMCVLRVWSPEGAPGNRQFDHPEEKRSAKILPPIRIPRVETISHREANAVFPFA